MHSLTVPRFSSSPSGEFVPSLHRVVIFFLWLRSIATLRYLQLTFAELAFCTLGAVVSQISYYTLPLRFALVLAKIRILWWCMQWHYRSAACHSAKVFLFFLASYMQSKHFKCVCMLSLHALIIIAKYEEKSARAHHADADSI